MSRCQNMAVFKLFYTFFTCVAHLNAADFGPIQVCCGSMPVRFSCVAGAKALAAGM